MSGNTPRDLSSELALYAFECAKEAKDKKMLKYPQYVKKMPAMIRNSGFAKTFAFGYSKNNNDGEVYKLIYSKICVWLKKKGLLDESVKDKDTESMIKALIGMNDYAKYRRCENETMAFLDWLRRLAEGMMPDETASSGGE